MMAVLNITLVKLANIKYKQKTVKLYIKFHSMESDFFHFINTRGCSLLFSFTIIKFYP